MYVQTKKIIKVVNTSFIMGRRSLAETIWTEYESDPKGDTTWLIVYDFQDTKPPTKLYDNINRVQGYAEGSLIQYSVYRTRDKRAAYTIRDLVRHYDGQVTVFKGEQVE